MISLKISVVPTKFFTVSFSTIHGNSLQSLFEYGRIMNSYRMKIKFENLKDFKTFLNNYTYHLDTDGMADDGSKGDLVTFDSLKDKIDVQLRYGAVYTDDGFDGEDYFSQISQFIEYNCEHAYNKFNFNENKINIENALKALNSEED